MLNLFFILLSFAGVGAIMFIGLILLASIYAVYDIDRELTDDLTDE